MTHILRLPFGRSVTFTKLHRHKQLENYAERRASAPAVVEDALLCAALEHLLLLLIDLGRLRLNFAGEGERSVN
jgi:hypothetical protein